jgi:hypothetical protein
VCGADRYSFRSFSWNPQTPTARSPYRSTIRMGSPSARTAIPARAGRWYSHKHDMLPPGDAHGPPDASTDRLKAGDARSGPRSLLACLPSLLDRGGEAP